MARGAFGRWFFGDDREMESPEEPQPEAPETAGSPYVGERDLSERQESAPQAESAVATPPGWYQTEGTLRYFDGQDWTNHLAPPYPNSLSTGGIAGAVFIGVLAALFVVWLGAQISPEHIYLPVKFVVKELPNL